MLRRLIKFSSCEDGGAAVEFVAAMLFFVVIVFFSFEVAGFIPSWRSGVQRDSQSVTSPDS